MELPIAPDAERAVVARILQTGGDALMELDFLLPEHFASKDARLVFEQAGGIWAEGGKPDFVVIGEILRDQGYPSPGTLLDPFRDKYESSPVDAGRLVYGKWLARQVIELGQEVAERGYTEDPTALLDEVERRSISLRPDGAGEGFKKLSTLARAGLESTHSVVPTGYSPFDAYLGGLIGGRLITIASRPGVGKTTLALNFAANAARKGFSAAIYSLEMSSDELSERLLINEARIPSHKIKSRNLSNEDVEKVAYAAWNMDQWRLYIDDASALSVFEIGARAKKLAHTDGLDLLIVDYLQLIDPPKADSRVQELAEITRYLKRLSRELRVPVVALSQLSRQAEMHDGEPRMSDLRESGSIENDSDQIIAMWTNPEDYSTDELSTTRASVIKNRHGATGQFQISFIKQQARFE